MDGAPDEPPGPDLTPREPAGVIAYIVSDDNRTNNAVLLIGALARSCSIVISLALATIALGILLLAPHLQTVALGGLAAAAIGLIATVPRSLLKRMSKRRKEESG
jgi:hypothetical protein